MPIYEYQCKECGYLHEALQKMSDAPLTDCPACGASALRKKVSAAAFRLKGSGWYETDFKSGDKKNLAGDGGKETSKDGGKDSAAGDGAGKTSDSKGGESSGGAAKDSKPAADKKSAGGTA